jgi:hypothetical protein
MVDKGNELMAARSFLDSRRWTSLPKEQLLQCFIYILRPCLLVYASSNLNRKLY